MFDKLFKPQDSIKVVGNGNKVAGPKSHGNIFTGGSTYTSSGSSTVRISNGNIDITCSKINTITINGKQYPVE